MAKVEDPLVNKFPGDWKAHCASTHDSAAAETTQRSQVFITKIPTSMATPFVAGLTDPDSYWMPTGGCRAL